MTDTAVIPEYEWGGHAFVWARPKGENWKEYDHTNGLGDGPREFRPCMVSGKDAGQSIRVLGSQYSYPLSEFEIAGECKPPVDLEQAREEGPISALLP